MNGAPLAVAARGLTKRFGSIVALDGLDVDIPPGSIVGLVGPTAAGKTTLLRILAGLARPSRGRVTISDPGSDTPLGAMDGRRRTGFAQAESGLYDWMTGRELLQFVGGLLGLGGDELYARIDEVLAEAKLEDDADDRISQYGPAARRRLAFAQAVMGRPDLLLLDEPFAGLDRAGQEDVVERVARLRSATTVLVATASLEDAARVCDRLVVLDRGQLVTDGSTGDILGAVPHGAFVVDVDDGDGPGVELLADTLRRQAWVRDVRVDGSRLRIAITHPELAALRIAPMLGTSGLRLRSVEREPATLDRLLASLGRADLPAGDATANSGAAAEAAR